MYFPTLRHGLHANLCVGGEHNYIRLVVNKAEREQENSLYSDGWVYHAELKWGRVRARHCPFVSVQ